jgi:hypothetical protein
VSPFLLVIFYVEWKSSSPQRDGSPVVPVPEFDLSNFLFSII